MIPKKIIDEIFEAAQIEEVVGDFVSLKKSGSSYKGLSPWTNEKTPSFYVVPSKGIFKDFSSGKGGNAVTFLMEHEMLSYPEALRWLAKKYNIEIPEVELTAEDIQEQNERESLAIINQFAANYFKDQLWNQEEGKAIGYSYFKERGFNDTIIEQFSLGYCPEKRDAFTQTALEKGYQLKYLQATGLTKTRDEKHFDFFHGRVIFPIRNLSGRVLAFGARTLKKDKGIAKYFNSPESELYHKSKVLYGLFEGKKEIVKQDQCYLVEGYTDVLAMHQAGVENVVASSGTSLTVEQIRLIRRYTKNITILYDGDAAGIRASFRGIDMVLEEGMNVRCVIFPEGHDPDSYSRELDNDSFQEYIQKSAQDFISFKAGILAEASAGDPIRRAEMIRDIVQSISLIPDHIARSVNIQTCSKLLQIPEQALFDELNKIIRGRIRKNGPPQLPELHIPEKKDLEEKSSISNVDTLLETELIRLLINYGDKTINIPLETEDENSPDEENAGEITVSVAEYILHELEIDNLKFKNPVYQKIINIYNQYLEEEKSVSILELTGNNDPEISPVVADLISLPYDLSPNWKTMHHIYVDDEADNLKHTVDSPLLKLRQWHLIKMIDQTDENIKSAKSEEELEHFLTLKMKLNESKSKISAYFGSAIL